jgi:hypothetical protein
LDVTSCNNVGERLLHNITFLAITGKDTSLWSAFGAEDLNGRSSKIDEKKVAG